MAPTMGLALIVAVLALATPAMSYPYWYNGWSNGWDGYLYKLCPNDQALTGVYSLHWNWKEDRLWAHRCEPAGDLTTAYSYSSVNGWDGTLSFTCPSGTVLYGVTSYHWNWKEDRRWSFYCKRQANSYLSHSSCYWTSYENDWDGVLYYNVPTGHVMVGMYSYHWNWKEDRRWRYHVCQIRCSSPWAVSGHGCVCPSGNYVSGSSCRPWTNCGRGQYSAGSPSSTRNRVCYSCRPGSYQDQSNHASSSCKTCPAGKFQNSFGQSDCKTCISTEYQDQSGQSSCKDCSTGYYRYNSQSQRQCEPGYKCPSNCARIPCEAGTYQPWSRRTSCFPCSQQSYQDQTGQNTCKPCSNGYYRVSAVAQSKCPSGYACSNCQRNRCSGEQYQDAEGQSSCKTSSKCGKGEYQSSAPSSTRPRQCSSCALGTNYMDEASHTSTSCKPVSICRPGTYVSVDPTKSSDRKCETCTSGFTATNNAGSCSSYSSCPAGQYLSREGTTTSDRKCSLCSLGVTYQDATSHTFTKCKPVKDACGPGTYEDHAPTLSSDRICRDCAPGKYSTSEDSSSCIDHSVCKAGYEESREPTRSTDRLCRACDGVNNYQDQDNQKKCKAVSTCSSGYYETAPPTPTSNRRCAKCTTESDCNSNEFLAGRCSGSSSPRCERCHSSCASCDGPRSDQCKTCPQGKTLRDGACVDNTCGQGEYFDGNRCRSCHSTCYECDGAGNTDCVKCDGLRFLYNGECRSTCPTGFYTITRARDNVCMECTQCSDGKYRSGGCTGSQDSVCTDWTQCKAGEKESVIPTATRDRKCVPCDVPTEYQNEAGKVFCKPTSICPGGSEVKSRPTAKADRTCQSCSAGHFSTKENQDSCLACPAGSYQDQTGASGCKECGATHYQPRQGQPSCFEIPAGYYGKGGSGTTHTDIEQCSPGYYCLGGSFSPKECEPGKFQDEAGKDSCKTVSTCDNGKLEIKPPTSSSDRVCGACKSGQFYDTESSSCKDWSDCQPGFYISKDPTSTSDRQCMSCDDGTFTSSTNQEKCTPHKDCPKGEELVARGTTSKDATCKKCPVGVSFKASVGPSECKPVTVCDVGKVEQTKPTASTDRVCRTCDGKNFYQDETGQTSCKPVSRCGAGELAAVDPSPEGDRQCEKCPPGHFQSQTSHTHDKCIQWTSCGAGSYVSKEGTATSDRECTACGADTWQDQPNQSSCKATTWCTYGEHMIKDGTSSSDRQCGKCVEGSSYQDQGRHKDTQCKPVTKCKAGEREVAAPIDRADRQCDQCDGETGYQDEVEQDECKTVTECSDTQYEVSAPTATSDRICLSCTSVDTCNQNEYLHGECGGDSGKANPRCAPCHPTCKSCDGEGEEHCLTCPANRHFRQGKCVDDCPDGEFEDNGKCSNCHSSCGNCNGAGVDKCTSCKGSQVLSENRCVDNCPSGTYNKNGVCEPCARCPFGQYAAKKCSGASDTVCEDWTDCKVGEYETDEPTSTTDRKCDSCKVGENYQSHPNSKSCKPVTECQPPNIEAQKPTASTDRVCTCDTKECAATVTHLFEELVCREPRDAELEPLVGECCLGVSEQALRRDIMQTEVYEERHSCDGCQENSCDCTKGFFLDHQDLLDAEVCVACDGETEYAPDNGASRCEPVTTCHQGQHEVAPPTQTSDRVCSFCPAGTIDHDQNGKTTCDACPVGAYVVPGSFGDCSKYTCPPGTADLDEDPSTPCQPCPAGATYQDKSGQTECKPVTVCEAGEEEAAPPTSQADRVCTPCASGMFKDKRGSAHKCEPVTECDKGQEEDLEPTPTSDRVCKSCELGKTFKAVSGQSALCVPVSKCAAGEEEVRSPTTSTDTVCRQCRLGTTFKEEDGPGTCQLVTRCELSEYMSKAATLTSDAECKALTECADDEFESRPATLSSDRTCTKCSTCPSGRFLLRDCGSYEDTQCMGCSTCKADEFIATACSDTRDTDCQKCEVCSDTEYMEEECGTEKDTVCKPLTVCGVDEFQVRAATKTSDRECRKLTQCKDDEYISKQHTLTSDRECSKITECVPGQEEVTKPTPLSDRECKTCEAGTTDHDGDWRTRCRSCSSGHYAPQGSIGPCEHFLCPGGMADTDKDSSTRCEFCEFGVSYSPQPGMTECYESEICEAGEEEFVPPTLYASRICSPCIEGRTFKADEGEDTRCKAVTQCAADEFETASPTRSTDRDCQEAKECNFDKEYIAQDMTATSDRVCAPYTSCMFKYQYQAVRPRKFFDRVCRNVTECTTEQFELQAPTNTSNRVCSPYTVCAENEVEVAPATPTSNRRCNRAWPLIAYLAGDFVALAGTPELYDSFVIELTEYLTSQGVDNSSIHDITLSRGSIIANIVFLDQDNYNIAHMLLLGGNFNMGGIKAMPCPKGQFKTTLPTFQGFIEYCKDYSSCGANEFESTAPTFTSDRECSFLTVCGAGQTEVVPATRTSDRQCGVQTTPPAESKASNAMSSGMVAGIVLGCLLIIIVVVAFGMWMQRKASKDKRQEQMVERLGRALNGDASDDISSGNRLLRQLSTKSGANFFDNPTFMPPTAAVDHDQPWYVGVMDRQEAEHYLRNNNGQPGDFCVRESATKGTHVLSLLVDSETFEHHKLYPDAHGRFMLNGRRLTKDCYSLIDVVEHLAQNKDGTTVLLNLPADEMYGQAPQAVAAGGPDFYGSVAAQEQGDFYGGIQNRPAWLMGTMTRQEAEQKLAEDRKPGRFLVRESKNRPGTYAISMVIDDGRIEHHSLQQDDSGVFLLNNMRTTRSCKTLPEVIDHLHHNIESMSCALQSPSAMSNPSYNSGSVTVNENEYSDLPGISTGVGISNPSYRGSSLRRPANGDGGYFDPAGSSGYREPDSNGDTGYREPAYNAGAASDAPGYLDTSDVRQDDPGYHEPAVMASVNLTYGDEAPGYADMRGQSSTADVSPYSDPPGTAESVSYATLSMVDDTVPRAAESEDTYDYNTLTPRRYSNSTA